MTELAGAHVIITGGSQGIGEAVAVAAVQAGARVSLVARDGGRLDALATRLGTPDAPVRWRSADVTDPDALAAAITALETEAGGCDVLVACAGLALPGRFLDVPFDELRTQLDVNYLGAVAAVRAVLPGMVARGRGHLVLTSSTAGLLGVFGYTGYAPSKWALRGFAESLRYEVEPAGVRVSLLYPPDTETRGFERENRRKPVETAAVSGAVRPVKAEVVARAVVAGIRRNRAHIAIDPLTRLLVRGGGMLEPLLRASMRSTIRRALR